MPNQLSCPLNAESRKHNMCSYLDVHELSLRKENPYEMCEAYRYNTEIASFNKKQICVRNKYVC